MPAAWNSSYRPPPALGASKIAVAAAAAATAIFDAPRAGGGRYDEFQAAGIHLGLRGRTADGHASGKEGAAGALRRPRAGRQGGGTLSRRAWRRGSGRLRISLAKRRKGAKKKGA